MEFDKNDVMILAQTILDEPLDWYDGDYGPHEHTCIFCDGKGTYYKKDFKHALDCPTLIAQDVLTRIEEA